MDPKNSVVLVGTDFSDPARAALDWALALARPLGSRILLAYVYELLLAGLPDATLMLDAPTAARMSDQAQRSLDAEVARVRERGVPVEGRLQQGDAREVLPQMALSQNAWLVVVGSHGRRGLARALMGSVAESVMRASTVPVAVVRPRRD